MGSLHDDLEALFADNGPLYRQHGFEYRPQQHAMARAVADALEEDHHLLIEAPTGVGKTLAYLLPAVLFGLRNDRKAIVSTHTKNLQEQLLLKDLPLSKQIVGAEFAAHTLKGRRNYLCTTRLGGALTAAAGLFVAEEEVHLQRIAAWAQTTSDGDVSTLGFIPPPAVWDAVCSEPGLCTLKTCGGGCFFQRAKDLARRARLLIVNHSLFFALLPYLQTDEQFLFPGDFVIFDEAHTLEAVAASGLGQRISRRGLIATLHRLYNPKTKRGLLAHEKRPVKSAFKGLDEVVEEFFAAVARTVTHLPRRAAGAQTESREVRVTTPSCVADTITHPLRDILARIEGSEERMEDEQQAQETAAARTALTGHLRSIEEFLQLEKPEQAYWIETHRPPQENVSLCMAPFHVGRQLGPRLFGAHGPVILTSATLSVGGSLAYVQERLGAGNARTAILDSPFDFRRQMKIWIAEDMPEPDSPGFRERLPDTLCSFVERSQGRALVLFTNSLLLRSVADALRERLVDRGLRLLVQGEELSRHQLLEEFRRDTSSVLFGLESFWMGIDVPGEALEHVIITRLPFSVPSHPLIEARLEDIENRGENPFLAYSLPEAVLKLRQGAGRLIRTGTDKGVVTILDSRVLTRPYGRIFLESLPRCSIELVNREGETRPWEFDAW